jgi:hypothetical protein
MKIKYLTYLVILTLLFFTLCQYNYGIKLNKLHNFTYGVALNDEQIPEDIKITSGPWIGGFGEINKNWFLRFNNSKYYKQIPYVNMYIIAGMASGDENLKDCNVGFDLSKTLCYSGANYIRNNKQKIYNSYKDSAYQIKKYYGEDKDIFLHFEPDFLQYSDNTQLGGGVRNEELSEMMNSWTDIYKKVLPNAKLVMDVSPWTQDLKSWSSLFRNFDYVGIVGRRFPPQGNPILNENSYKQIVELTGKKLIINDAHGPGGKWLPYNKDWEDEDLVKARFADGVVAVIQPPTDIESLTKVALKSQQSTSD